MKQIIKGSMTVEAALLYPFLLLITFLLIKITVYQYRAVLTQAAELFDDVFTERELQAPELLRAADTAFDFFEK
ncbi:MAG: hypothetical protein PUC30_00845 [Lachnospiraceae bacterium]|nr:hypothetical protein [Lachnospiraceae bacterium]